MGWREWDTLRTTRACEVDLGAVFEAVAAQKRWLIGLPLAALVLIGVVLGLQPPRYSAEVQIRIDPRHAGLIGLRANLALLDANAASQAQLIASRDLGRRAIEDLGLEDNPEFDPVTRGLGPGVRALIFLGIMRDPARKSPHDRVLEAYQDRLQVRTSGGGNLVTIAFQSGDPELAANAANIIADLYLEMRAGARLAAGLPPTANARIVSRAITPNHPVYPRQPLLVLSGTAMLVMAFGALVAMVQPRGPLRVPAPLEHPRALGQVRIFARFKDVAEPTPRPKLKLAPPALQGKMGVRDSGDEQAMTKIVTRILSMRGRAPRGIRIVVTSLQATSAVTCMLLDLARSLARKGRSIVIGLDESYPLDFQFSTAGAPHGGPPAAEPALGDLLAGTASFAEVIRRDAASRLHFLPVGRTGELDLREFANVIDALAGIYDFIVTIAPPLDRNGIAGTIAGEADVVLLAAQGESRGGTLAEAEAKLVESGAREVLLIGLPVEPARSLGLDAA